MDVDRTKPLKQSWATDLDSLIPHALRSEVADDEPLDCRSDRILSHPGSFSPWQMIDDSPRSLQEPVFGFTSSPFATSLSDIQNLDRLFDDYQASPDTEAFKAVVVRRPPLRSRSHPPFHQLEHSSTTITPPFCDSPTLGDVRLSLPALFLQPPPPPPPDSLDYYSTPDPAGAIPTDIQCVAAWSVDCFCSTCLSRTTSIPASHTTPLQPPDSATSVRSPAQTSKSSTNPRTFLLNEFKQRAGVGFQLSDLWGHMFYLSRDQVGSRFLQQQLSIASASDQEHYFNEISRQALSISGDVFGNFIIQILLDSQNPAIIWRLIQIIKPHVVLLSTRQYGCRVIQKAVETLPYEQKLVLMSTLEGSVEYCAHNEHGNHVIQRCLQHVDPDDIAFMYTAIIEKTMTMSCDKYGCRVVQRAIERREQEVIAEPIRQRVASNAVELAFDEFGNFVVQKLLRLAPEAVVDTIVESFIPHLTKLSCQKYPSNVVETALAVCSTQSAERIKLSLLGPDLSKDTSQVANLIHDRFGRYVVEKLVKMCSEYEKTAIRQTAQSILRSVKNQPTQKNLVKRVQRLLAAL